AVELFHHPLSHGGTDGVMIAAEKYRMWDRSSHESPRHKRANQGEQAARCVDVDDGLTLQPFLQGAGALVVDAATRHVDRLDLRRRQTLYRIEIAGADLEVILNRLTKRAKRQVKLNHLAAAFGRDVKDQPPLAHRQRQRIGAGW